MTVQYSASRDDSLAARADNLIDLPHRVHRWHLKCRGSFTLSHPDGRDAGPRGRKARAILAYLVAHLTEHVSRDRLVELLWPERADFQARGSLRQSLLEIRRAAPGLIWTDQQHVWIERHRVHFRDAEQELSENLHFADLDGITVEFDDWLRTERAKRAGREWSELRRRVEIKLKRGHGSGALPLIERMQRIDPYNEDWLRLAMRAECQAGHPAGIQTRFQEMKDVLRRDLGVDVSAQSCSLRNILLSEVAQASEPGLGVSTRQAETSRIA